MYIIFRPGIYSRNQLINNNSQIIYKSNKKISVTLYDQISDLPDAQEIAEHILLNFADDRGAYKRTYKNRFAKFDQRVINFLLDKIKKEEFIIHDMAVSNGQTAVDFYEKLKNNFTQSFKYYASDYDPYVYVYETSFYKVALNSQNKVLEVVMAPFVLNIIKPESWLYFPFNRLLIELLKVFFIPKLQKKIRKSQLRKICLFSWDAQKLAVKDSNFQLMQYNMLQPPPLEPINIIRAMNVLNNDYFASKDIRKILRNIYYSLKEGGFFIVGSNLEKDSKVNGAVYKKYQGKFKLVWQSYTGPPIKNYIDAFIY